jgi:hypothetical protein
MRQRTVHNARRWTDRDHRKVRWIHIFTVSPAYLDPDVAAGISSWTGPNGHRQACLAGIQVRRLVWGLDR